MPKLSPSSFTVSLATAEDAQAVRRALNSLSVENLPELKPDIVGTPHLQPALHRLKSVLGYAHAGRLHEAEQAMYGDVLSARDHFQSFRSARTDSTPAQLEYLARLVRTLDPDQSRLVSNKPFSDEARTIFSRFNATATDRDWARAACLATGATEFDRNFPHARDESGEARQTLRNEQRTRLHDQLDRGLASWNACRNHVESMKDQFWSAGKGELYTELLETGLPDANSDSRHYSRRLAREIRLGILNLIEDRDLLAPYRDKVDSEGFIDPLTAKELIGILPASSVRCEVTPAGIVLYLGSSDYEALERSKLAPCGWSEGIAISSDNDALHGRVAAVRVEHSGRPLSEDVVSRVMRHEVEHLIQFSFGNTDPYSTLPSVQEFREARQNGLLNGQGEERLHQERARNLRLYALQKARNEIASYSTENDQVLPITPKQAGFNLLRQTLECVTFRLNLREDISAGEKQGLLSIWCGEVASTMRTFRALQALSQELSNAATVGTIPIGPKALCAALDSFSIGKPARLNRLVEMLYPGENFNDFEARIDLRLDAFKNLLGRIKQVCRSLPSGGGTEPLKVTLDMLELFDQMGRAMPESMHNLPPSASLLKNSAPGEMPEIAGTELLAIFDKFWRDANVGIQIFYPIQAFDDIMVHLAEWRTDAQTCLQSIETIEKMLLTHGRADEDQQQRLVNEYYQVRFYPWASQLKNVTEAAQSPFYGGRPFKDTTDPSAIAGVLSRLPGLRNGGTPSRTELSQIIDDLPPSELGMITSDILQKLQVSDDIGIMLKIVGKTTSSLALFQALTGLQRLLSAPGAIEWDETIKTDLTQAAMGWLDLADEHPLFKIVPKQGLINWVVDIKCKVNQ